LARRGPRGSDDMAFNTFHLFAGAGGGILADILLGHIPVGAVEIEEYPRQVLLQRQRDGMLPPFPIWDDVCTFRSDNPETREYIERLRSIAGRLIIAGGFPCQDISCAGKGEGITGARSGLWSEMARIVCEIRPRHVYVENSPMLVGRGLAVVLGDLAKMGYNARWGIVGADDAGAPHRRKRIWIVADAAIAGPQEREVLAGYMGQEQPTVERGRVAWWDVDPADVADPYQLDGNRRGHGTSTVCRQQRKAPEIPGCKEDMANAAEQGLSDGRRSQVGRTGETVAQPERSGSEDGEPRSTQPFMGRVAHGIPDRVDQLKAIGNGQVPAVAALAWRIMAGAGENS